MSEFVVVYDKLYLKSKSKIASFIEDLTQANTYPSRYAAKKHLRTLDNVPTDVKIVAYQDVA
jgi:hypothetical protein